MKKLLALILLACVLSMPVMAKMPVKGDHVQILAGSGISIMAYVGTIEEIKEGLLCMKCEYSKIVGDDDIDKKPKQICVGIGQIISLQWVDEKGTPV